MVIHRGKEPNTVSSHKNSIMSKNSTMKSSRSSLRLQFFNLKMLINSHGWVQLCPFQRIHNGIIRHEKLGKYVFQISVKESKERLIFSFISSEKISLANKENLKSRCRYMVGSDIDLTEFLSLAEKLDGDIFQFAKAGGARFLRGTTLFEDVLKTLFTTNASWKFTQLMCQRIVRECKLQAGEKTTQDYFPSIEEINDISISRLKNHCKLGYRSSYVKNIVRAFSENDRFHGWTTADILDCMSHVSGLGKYCVNHIAILLGKYDRIPIDSAVRSYIRNVGAPDDDKSIMSMYDKWHPYQFLAYKLDRRIRNNNWIGDISSTRHDKQV